jgi:hypothetical protein
MFSSHTADSKPVKQEVNGTVIFPPLVFPGSPHYPKVGGSSSAAAANGQNNKLQIKSKLKSIWKF